MISFLRAPYVSAFVIRTLGGRREAREDAEIREGMESWLAGCEVKVLKVFKI